jgi:hypothetical protein
MCLQRLERVPYIASAQRGVCSGMEFHIQGRVENEGPDSYCSVVVAVIPGEKARIAEKLVGPATTSYAAATKALRELCVEMGARIRGRGDTIMCVDLDS